MSDEPESVVLQILRQMRAEMGATRESTDAKFADLREEMKSELHSLRADFASDLLTTRKELSEQIVGLRRAVVDDHTSVIGHGMPIGDLDARVRRVEQHLNLPPMISG